MTRPAQTLALLAGITAFAPATVHGQPVPQKTADTVRSTDWLADHSPQILGGAALLTVVLGVGYISRHNNIRDCGPGDIGC